MNNTLGKNRIASGIFSILLVVSLFLALPVSQSFALNFTNASMRYSRMAKSVVADSNNPILIIFKPSSASTAGTEASIGISFASGYTVGSYATVTTSTSNLPTSYHGLTPITAVPTLSAAAVAVSSGQNVVFTCGNLAAGTVYGFYITAGITNPTTTGSKVSKLSTHTDADPDFSAYGDAIDSSRVATYVVEDNGTATDSDQIVVTARVAPTYTLTLSGQAITLDTSLSTVEYPGGTNNAAVNGITATATTNANNGHVMWLKAASASGLTSTVASASIPFIGTAANGLTDTLSAGTEGVVVDVNKTTDNSLSLAVAAEFDGTGNASGGTPSTSFQEIASASGPVGGAGDVVTILPRVAISATTQAADDYTNTFTVVGAGNF